MAFSTVLKKAARFLTATLFCGLFSLSSKAVLPLPVKIGVIQVIEHTALDETRKGIQDELAEQFQDKLQWSWESAQGNPALATQIAQKYAGQQVSLMIAIGTTAAQAALNVTQNSSIPVVYASVTDPGAAKLKGNIAGVSNFVSPQKQFEVIQKLMNPGKRIGVIYNPGETNSAALVAQMQTLAKQIGFEIIPATAARTSEVSAAALNLVQKTDAIFINNDNTALAAINGVGRICLENKIPLFISDGDLNASQALAVIGADQYEIGRQAGKLAARIIRGEVQAPDMEIQYPKKIKVSLNSKVAADLKISLPEEMKTGEATQ